MFPRLLTLAHRASRFVLDALGPLRCVGCQAEGSILCSGCEQSIRRTPATFPGGSGQPLLCTITAAAHDEPLIQTLIHILKYSHIHAAAEPLARWLADALRPVVLPGDVLVPIPLHTRRKRERGFNQSERIAQRIGEQLHLPVSLLVQRTRWTKPQVECDGEERRSNLTDAFRARPTTAQRIILVDDVTTTGSTLQEAAQALRKVTAIPIIGATVARG